MLFLFTLQSQLKTVPDQDSSRVESEEELEDCVDCSKLKKKNVVLNAHNLRLQGQITNLRHKEAIHVRARLQSQLSGRAIKIVDNAVFASTVHSSDQLVDDLAINIIDELSLTPVSSVTVGQFSTKCRIFSVNGELVLGQSYDVPSSQEELRLCYHELQMLRYLGKHVNIIDALGLYVYQNRSYSVVLHVEKNLEYFLLKGGVSGWQGECLVQGIRAALQHLSMKSVLIHTLSNISVLVQELGGVIRPLLSNFQLACRMEVALPWNDSQIKKFATKFLAPELRCGKSPTPTSDVYSFGIVVQDVLNCCTLRPRVQQAFKMLVMKSVCDAEIRRDIDALASMCLEGY